MSERVRGAITTVPADHVARVTSTERIESLLEALWEYGPEPEGVVVGIDEAALDELPDGWQWEPMEGRN